MLKSLQQLQDLLVGMMVRTFAELMPTVRQDGIDLCLMSFEETHGLEGRTC